METDLIANGVSLQGARMAYLLDPSAYATVKGLAGIYGPVLAGFGGSILLGNVIADALGFGKAEKEKRAYHNRWQATFPRAYLDRCLSVVPCQRRRLGVCVLG